MHGRVCACVGAVKPVLRYLSAWFCPFAHRATLALEHHADRWAYLVFVRACVRVCVRVQALVRVLIICMAT